MNFSALPLHRILLTFCGLSAAASAVAGPGKLAEIRSNERAREVHEQLAHDAQQVRRVEVAMANATKISSVAFSRFENSIALSNSASETYAFGILRGMISPNGRTKHSPLQLRAVVEYFRFHATHPYEPAKLTVSQMRELIVSGKSAELESEVESLVSRGEALDQRQNALLDSLVKAGNQTDLDAFVELSRIANPGEKDEFTELQKKVATRYLKFRARAPKESLPMSPFKFVLEDVVANEPWLNEDEQKFAIADSLAAYSGVPTNSDNSRRLTVALNSAAAALKDGANARPWYIGGSVREHFARELMATTGITDSVRLERARELLNTYGIDDLNIRDLVQGPSRGHISDMTPSAFPHGQPE